MTKASSDRRKKTPIKIDFDTLLSLLNSMSEEQRMEWNRELNGRCSSIINEQLKRTRANVEDYVKRTGAPAPVREKIKGQVILDWEIDFTAKGKTTLRLHTNNLTSEYNIFGGNKVCDSKAAARFAENIERRILSASSRLMEASSLYVSEKIEKSNPYGWRNRLISEEKRDLRELSGYQKEGRRVGTVKNWRKIGDAHDKLKVDVIRAVTNLYDGKSNGANRCPEHCKSKCPGHDEEEIICKLVAGYLNMSYGWLRTKLSNARLSFPALKQEALTHVTK